MSMEEQVGRLATAIEGLTAAINGASKPAAPVQPVPADKPATTKAKAASKPAPAPEPEQVDLGDGLGGEDEALTLEDVRAKLFEVRDTVARDRAAKILGQLGAKSIDTIPEAKFAEAVALCEKALAGKK